jgi:hypothetical protein
MLGNALSNILSNRMNPNTLLFVKIGILLVFLIIIAITLYFYFKKNSEGFENATDLLERLKSSESQKTSESSNTDPELTIHPWSTKLYNLTNQNIQTRPLGLYKPHLNINSKRYMKLGDMITLNTDYSPPSNNDFTVLLNKTNSSFSTPVKYNLLVNFGSSNTPGYYYDIQNAVNLNTDLNAVFDNITSLQTLTQSIIATSNITTSSEIVKNLVIENSTISIGNSSIPISNVTEIAQNNLPSYTTAITNDTLLQLPIGLQVDFISNTSTQQQQQITTPNNKVNLSTYCNVNKAIIDFTKLQLAYNRTSRQSDKLTFNEIQVNLFGLSDQIVLVTYLQNICDKIITIYNLPSITQQLIEYLNLADSLEGVNTVYTALSTINVSNTNPNDPALINVIKSVDILKSYALTHPSTMLGKLLNHIISSTITIIQPIIIFNANELRNYILANLSKYINTGVTTSIASQYIQTILTNVSSIEFTNVDNVQLSAHLKITSSQQSVFKLTTTLSNFINFKNAIANKTLSYLPLQIYEPIAPNGFVTLGHIFCNTNRDFYKINTSNSVACVPQECIKEMREWQTSDKVFEYSKTGDKYWAIYKNPYVGTFIAVNRPGLPAGKVSKVVACVKKCTAVEDLEKADDCSRKYNQLNKSIMKNVTDTPDIVGSTEEAIYLGKIKNHAKMISNLKSRAQQMQIDVDKAEIVTNEMNKRKLQDFVDKQKLNIDLVTGRLENDKNKIETNINIPLEDLNRLLQLIRNLPMDESQKQEIISSIIKNKTLLDKNIITLSDYNANVNKILESCPQYDLTGLVRKDLVGDVCYGCGTPS